MTFPIIPM